MTLTFKDTERKETACRVYPDKEGVHKTPSVLIREEGIYRDYIITYHIIHYTEFMYYINKSVVFFQKFL